jgi:hypothetical protein
MSKFELFYIRASVGSPSAAHALEAYSWIIFTSFIIHSIVAIAAVEALFLHFVYRSIHIYAFTDASGFGYQQIRGQFDVWLEF